MGYGRPPFHGGGPGQGWGQQGGFRGRDGGRGFGGQPGGPGMMGGRSMGGHGMKPGMGGRGMGSGSTTPPDPAQMADMMLNHLSSRLTLTDDEKAKIKPILEQQAAQMQKDRDAQHQVTQKAIEDTRAKIKPLLTPDQQKALDALPLPGRSREMRRSPARNRGSKTPNFG